jgi:hypothetical protein
VTFDATPLADGHFSALAGPHVGPVGTDGRDLEWSMAGARGFGNGQVRGLPSDMPGFRYGIDDGCAFLSVRHEGCIYRRRGDVRQVVLEQRLPQTALAALPGRPLIDLVDLAGCGDDVIGDVDEVDEPGGRRTMLTLDNRPGT